MDFQHLVNQVNIAVRENFGDFNNTVVESLSLEILARVYNACPNNHLPKPEGLPTIIEG